MSAHFKVLTAVFEFATSSSAPLAGSWCLHTSHYPNFESCDCHIFKAKLAFLFFSCYDVIAQSIALAEAWL